VKFARRFVPGKFSQNDPLAQASRYLFGSFCEISQCFFQVISNGREDNHDSSTAQTMINSGRKSLILDIYMNGMCSNRNPAEFVECKKPKRLTAFSTSTSYTRWTLLFMESQ
jgi:hypothetical protein